MSNISKLKYQESIVNVAAGASPEKSSKLPSMTLTSSVFEQNPEYLKNMEKVKSLKTEISLLNMEVQNYENMILDLQTKCKNEIKTLRKKPNVYTDADEQKESVQKLHQARVNLVFAQEEYHELMNLKKNKVDLLNINLQKARKEWGKILSELDIDFNWSNVGNDDSDDSDDIEICGSVGW